MSGRGEKERRRKPDDQTMLFPPLRFAANGGGVGGSGGHSQSPTGGATSSCQVLVERSLHITRPSKHFIHVNSFLSIAGLVSREGLRVASFQREEDRGPGRPSGRAAGAQRRGRGSLSGEPAPGLGLNRLHFKAPRKVACRERKCSRKSRGRSCTLRRMYILLASRRKT